MPVVIDFVHYICCIFEVQMTLLTVTEMTFRGNSRSSVMSSFVRLLGLNHWKSRLHLFQIKVAEMTLKV